MKSGDVSRNPGPTGKSGSTHQNIRVVVVERVSLVAVDLFSATPVTSRHITNVLACFQMMSTMNSAAAVANLHYCAIGV